MKKSHFLIDLYDYIQKNKFTNGNMKLTKKSKTFLQTGKFPEKTNFNILSDLIEKYKEIIINSGVFFKITEKGGIIFKASLMSRFLIDRYKFISTEEGDIYHYKNGIYNSGASGIIKRISM